MKSIVEFKILSISGMKTLDKVANLIVPKMGSHIVKHWGLALALALGVSVAAAAAEPAKTFATPEEAVTALEKATATDDGDALRAVFGPAAADLQNPDRVQATNEFKAFTTA